MNHDALIAWGAVATFAALSFFELYLLALRQRDHWRGEALALSKAWRDEIDLRITAEERAACIANENAQSAKEPT